MRFVFGLSWSSKLRRCFDIEIVEQDVRQTVDHLAEKVCALNCHFLIQFYIAHVVAVLELPIG